LVKEVAIEFNKRSATLLPDSKEQLDAIFSQTTITKESPTASVPGPPKALHYKVPLPKVLAVSTTTSRNVTWIEENGMCVDNLVPQKSTIPHAGLGAFAQRFLSKGSRVVPVPLLQIPYRESLLMYQLNEKGERVSDEPVGTQLLLNYCFGHDETTLLLCPASNAILINHCSGRKESLFVGQCAQDKGPNAEIRWADWDPLTETWQTMSVQEINELTKVGKRGLSFDVIALRDIQPGEEVRFQTSISIIDCPLQLY